MINFPTTYPYKITNGYETELCGIPAGGTLIIGPSNINGTLDLYNSYAELVEQYLSDQTFSAHDMSDNALESGIAASAFTNLRSSVIEYQKMSFSQMNNLTVTQYMKLTPITTDIRNSIPQDAGTLVLNSDTNEIEVLKSGHWGTSVGPQGARGYQGFRGNTGSAGAQGARGFQGFKGNTGNTGNTGAQGARGYQGFKGNTGSAGAQGARGFQGFRGNTGSAGAQGARGFQGYRGYQGPSVSTTGLVANVPTNRVSTISVVSALPGSPDANTLYFIMA